MGNICWLFRLKYKYEYYLFLIFFLIYDILNFSDLIGQNIYKSDLIGLLMNKTDLRGKDDIFIVKVTGTSSRIINIPDAVCEFSNISSGVIIKLKILEIKFENKNGK